MSIEIWTRDRTDANGFPKLLHSYTGQIVPQLDSWIALGKGDNGTFPAWRVIKVIHLVDLDRIKVEVTGY